MRSTRFLFAAMPVVMLACVPLAWASDAQQPPAQQQAAQPPATPQPPAEQKFTSAVGMYYSVIKADKIADFEKFLARFHAALAKTDNELRRKQAAGWRVYKSAQPDPQGNVVFLFWLDPAVADADYSITKIMVDVLPPGEVRPLWDTISGAWLQSARLNLDLVANFGAPPAGMNELNLNK